MDVNCDTNDCMSIYGDESESEAKKIKYSTSYSKNDLKDAVEKVKTKEMSIGRASVAYNVPKTTLHRALKDLVSKPRGALTTLTKVQEKELAEWILLHQLYGDPRTKLDIQIVAGEIAALDSSKHHFKHGVPTSGWVERFLERHPEISLRTPEALSKASSINTQEDFAGLWRNIYGYLQKNNQLDLLNKPDQWYNADETGFEKDVMPLKVFARKGAKNVYRCEKGRPKDRTTVTYAFSASGDHVQPLITFKDSTSTLQEIAYALGSVGANYGINQTSSGWTQTESFYYFVTMHLIREWDLKQIPRPIILTIDGYKAHLSLRLFRWCRLNDVILVVLYPGATPYMQMCDTTMFAPLKRKQVQVYSQWRLKNPEKNLNEIEFVKILKQVNDEVIKKEMIVNGWRSTGLQPFDFNNLNLESLPSKSPNYVYSFKGDILNPPQCSTSIQTTTNASILDSSSSNFNIGLLSFNTEAEDAVDRPCSSISQHSIEQQHQLSDNVIESSSDCVTAASNDNFIASFNDSFEHTFSNSLIETSNEPNLIESSNDSFEDEMQAHNTALSSINRRDRIFQSSFDTNFNLASFGVKNGPSKQNEDKISKIVEKIRRDVKDLAFICAANDKEKLLNILIINQQLNIIESTEDVYSDVPTTSTDRTINSILKPPTMPQRVRPKQKRNLKIGYGVVTSNEIINEMERQEVLEAEHEIEWEEHEINKNKREQEIQRTNEQLRELREELKLLRSEHAVESKKTVGKKRSKPEIKNDSIAKAKRLQIIKESNERLSHFRLSLTELRASHVTANKAMALKKKEYHEQTKNRNIIQPSLPSPQDTENANTINNNDNIEVDMDEDIDIFDEDFLND